MGLNLNSFNIGRQSSMTLLKYYFDTRNMLPSPKIMSMK